MNILILTGKFGMGHWSASQSLRQQLQASFPEACVTVEDFLAWSMPDASETIYKGFDLLVTHGSGIFNTYYRMTENVATETPQLLESFFLDKLQQLLELRRPDAVIATHPFCAKTVSRYKRETRSRLPLVTCITDLSSHSEWINTGTDCYLVGSDEIRERLAKNGVERGRVLVTGIPVRSEFKHPGRRSGDGERHLLIMGGGLGLMPKRERFYEELNAMPGVKTVLIAGGNEKLRERLEGRYENIEVLGFTDRVYEYMAWADLVLTKPGGITLFETIFSELPILAWEPFLQQEINNARFLLRSGIGRIARKGSEECLSAISGLIYDTAALERMRENMRRLKSQLEEESLNRLLSGLMKKGACA